MFTLIIGDKNYSSWSLRPWLVLKMLGEPFDEQHIRLRTPKTTQQILAINPAGKVPVLLDQHLMIADSLAICEYLAESFPQARLWPVEQEVRAIARACCAEMHAGFGTLRSEMPMDIGHRHPSPSMSLALEQDIQRILSLWQNLRQQFAADGPFLFGHFTIADAFFAPVVTRFITYQIEIPELARAWMETIQSLPAMQEWQVAAEAEIAGETAAGTIE